MAVVLAGGVLIGSAAIAMDVGNLMFERRQLQNGSDNAAWRMATACDKASANCSPTVGSTRTSMLNALMANASDGQAQLDNPTWAPNGACGHVKGVPSSTLPACPSEATTQSAEDLNVCSPLPDWLKNNLAVVNYVEVYSLTKTAAGGDKVKSFFNMGDGTPVGSCSRVAWGPAKPVSQLPLTFGQCEWLAATGATTTPNPAYVDYATTPNVPPVLINYDSAVYGKEVALALNYKNNNACSDWQGHDYPGGFGWLDHATGVCSITPDINGWYPGWPGEGAGNDCIDKVYPGAIIFVPIYDCIDDDKKYCPDEKPSAHTNYHIVGMAQFQVTAIQLPSKNVGTPGATAQADCNTTTTGKHCLFGYFTQKLIPTGDFNFDPNAPDYGITHVEAAG